MRLVPLRTGFQQHIADVWPGNQARTRLRREVSSNLNSPNAKSTGIVISGASDRLFTALAPAATIVNKAKRIRKTTKIL